MNPLRESRIVRLSLLLFFALLIAYGVYEAGSLLWGPQIKLPGDTVVISESHATIRGATQNVADLTLNGTVVSMTEDGVFEKEVVLMPGSNRFVLTAHDKYGRSRESAVDILYIPPRDASPPPRRAETAPITTPDAI